MNKLFSNKKQEKGQGLVEYAIILALVAIVVIAVMRVMGPKVGCTFSSINNSIPGGSGSSGSNCGGADAFATTWSAPRMGAYYAGEQFCVGKPTGTAFNVINVGSGWFVAGGSGTTPGSYPGPESSFATLDSSGTCP